MLDLERLLAPVSREEPSGPLLEYDPSFVALFEAAKGRPEQRMGASVIPAQPPEWRKVAKSATALLARTKDLRVATQLVKAMLDEAGAPGLYEGIAFFRALLERHWETVHPQLEADDPSMRINAIADLADEEAVLARYRGAEVASARGVGRISVRDLERSTWADKAAAAADPGAPSLDVVLEGADRAAVAKIAQGTSAAVQDVQAIEAFVAEKVGAGRAPNLAKLTALLQVVAKVLADRLRKYGIGAERQPDPGGVPAGAPTEPQGGAGSFTGAINSRKDVLAALDGICAYYERLEPSSPIPLLLKRSKRLVAMSFVDIVRDLVPDALPHVEALGGKHD